MITNEIEINNYLTEWNHISRDTFSLQEIKGLTKFIINQKVSLGEIKSYFIKNKADIQKLMDYYLVSKKFLEKNVVTNGKNNVLNRLFNKNSQERLNSMIEVKVGEFYLDRGFLIKSEPTVNGCRPEYEILSEPKSYIEVISTKATNYLEDEKIITGVKEVLSKFEIKNKIIILTINSLDCFKKSNQWKDFFLRKMKEIIKNDLFHTPLSLLGTSEVTVWVQPNSTDNYVFNRVPNYIGNLVGNNKLILMDYCSKEVIDIKGVLEDKRKQFKSLNSALTLFINIELYPSETNKFYLELHNLIETEKVPSFIYDIILISPGYFDDGFHFNYKKRFINKRCKYKISPKISS